MNHLYTPEYLASAHRKSIFHQKEITRSEACGCFHCLKTYPASEIKEWVEEDNGKEKTALCPYCGIDAVLGDASGFEVSTTEFLKAIKQHYFLT